MPEGDTVYRHAAELTAALVGRPIDTVWVRGLPQPALAGRTVDRADAIGKNLLLGFGDVTLRVHLGIAGRWYRMTRAELTPGKAARAHVVLVAGSRAWVCVKARSAELLRTAFAERHRGIVTLGPDLLSDDFDLEAAVARATPRARDPVGEVLLDQRVVAGIGNVYKSEACFLEHVHPFYPADAATLSRLLSRARSLMQTNLGPWRRTTTSDLSRALLPERGRGRYWVYNRRGRPCYVCESIIESRPQGEAVRPTYWCPRCQPLPG